MMPMQAPPPGPPAGMPAGPLPGQGGPIAAGAAGMPDLSQLTPQQLQMLMQMLAAAGAGAAPGGAAPAPPAGPPPGIPQPTVGGAPPQGILSAADQGPPAAPGPANTHQAIQAARKKGKK